jgi:outer membrane protein assembly factor BamB
LGPGLFGLLDTDRDGVLTRSEIKGTFEKWASEWDTNKLGSLDQEQLRAGLDAALPRPSFGGPGGPGGRGGPGGGDPARGCSWSTPIVINAAGREEVILSTAGRLAAYDPASGKQLWLSKGLGASIYTTPVFGDGVLFATTSGPGGGPAIAVKPGGSGDVTASHRVWRLARAKSAIGSGVIQDGCVYTITQDGTAQCLDLKTGKTIWEEPLRGPSGRGSSWSSMLLADGKIYVPNQSGDVFVLRAVPKFEVLATNSVAEPTNASLAASNGDLFLRTEQSLWCLGRAE